MLIACHDPQKIGRRHQYQDEECFKKEFFDPRLRTKGSKVFSRSHLALKKINGSTLKASSLLLIEAPTLCLLGHSNKTRRQSSAFNLVTLRVYFKPHLSGASQ